MSKNREKDQKNLVEKSIPSFRPFGKKTYNRLREQNKICHACGFGYKGNFCRNCDEIDAKSFEID